MKIRILRNTIAVPVGEVARAVDAGEMVDVDAMQARQLIALRKAVEITSPPVTVQTPEDALTPLETRTAGNRKGRSTT